MARAVAGQLLLDTLVLAAGWGIQRAPFSSTSGQVLLKSVGDPRHHRQRGNDTC
jgi:hypothetical protein